MLKVAWMRSSSALVHHGLTLVDEPDAISPRRTREIGPRRKTNFTSPSVPPSITALMLRENQPRPTSYAMPCLVAASSVRPTMATSGME